MNNTDVQNMSYDLIAMGNKDRNFDDANVVNGFVINEKNELEHYIDKEGVSKAVVPDGIKKIPRHVFYECRFLESLYIPNSVEEFRTDLMHCNNFKEFIVEDDNPYFTVKDGVLYSKDMTVLIYCPNGITTRKFVVPDGVIEIEDGAFAGCINIEEIILPESVDGTGYDAFMGCSSLKSIRMPEHMRYMRENAFFGCTELAEITYPNGIRDVGANDLDWCHSLRKITFGKDMEFPDDFSLALPELEEIVVDPENPYITSEDGILYDKAKTILLCCAQGKEGEVVIPDTVTQIGFNKFSRGFAYCDKITKIKVPKSVRHIYVDAFEDCSAEVEFEEPDKIEYFKSKDYFGGEEGANAKYHVTVLNIHGYHGSPENVPHRTLKDLKCETVVSPEIDYDSESPESVLNRLRYYVSHKFIDFIVGTSLGGFYAAVLAAEFDLPVILINPCLMPFLHLPRLGYKGDIEPFISMFGTLTDMNEENVCCIVGDADEIIDSHDLTERMFGNERFRRIPEGKHSGATLPLNDYFAEVISYCDNLRIKKYLIKHFGTTDIFSNKGKVQQPQEGDSNIE